MHPRAVGPSEVQRFQVGGIEAEVRRMPRRRRSMLIRVEQGQAVVLAPEWVPDAQVRRFIESKADWVRLKLAATPAVAIALPASLPVRGVWRPVGVSRGAARNTVRANEDGIAVSLRADQDEEAAIGMLREWLREQTRVLVAERLAARTVEMGWTPAKVVIKDTRRRWGSHSSTGTVAFNLRLAMLSPELLDLVVVHELAHHWRKDHSPAFWAIVERHAPAYRDLRKRLRAEERAIPWLGHSP